MRTLDRYLTRLFLRDLALTLGVLVGLYGLIEFLERVDDFIGHEATVVHYLRYPLYKLPLMINQTLPMAVLLAAFATIGQLSRTQQITALRCGGISFWQTTRPLFVCGALLSAVMFVGNCWIAPWSGREAKYLFEMELRKKTPPAEITSDLYLRDGQRILQVQHAYPQKGEIQGVMLLEFDPHFGLVRRLDAETARYVRQQTWELQRVVERRFDPVERKLTGFARFEALPVDLGREPGELTEFGADPAELSLPELADVSARLQREGQSPRRYLTEFHFRIAQSVTPLIVVLLGVPFALQRGRQATLGVGVALCLAVFIGYIVLQAIGMALGSAGLLPLPVAAWAANILLLLIGAWLFLTLDN